MADTNDRIKDAMIRHLIGQQRLTNGEVKKALSVIDKDDVKLLKMLKQGLSKSAIVDSGLYSEERISRLLRAVDGLIDESMRRTGQAVGKSLEEIAAAEFDFTNEMVDRAMPPVAGVELRRPNPHLAHHITHSRPFQGRLLKDWYKHLAKDKRGRLRLAIREGIGEGLHPRDMTRNIRKAGILRGSRHAVTRVTRTATMHVLNNARDAWIDENKHVVKAVQWIATLDNRTSSYCIARDGLLYTAEGRKPLDHGTPWDAGPGRLHWQCRSTSAPVLMSADELGIPADQVPKEVRESMTGKVPGKTTYEDWIVKQPAGTIRDVLGPSRYQLLRKGKLPFDRFINDYGDWINLDQLRKIHTAAFRRAGL